MPSRDSTAQRACHMGVMDRLWLSDALAEPIDCRHTGCQSLAAKSDCCIVAELLASLLWFDYPCRAPCQPHKVSILVQIAV